MTRNEVMGLIDAGNVTHGDVSGALIWAALGGTCLKNIFSTDNQSPIRKEINLGNGKTRTLTGASNATQMRGMFNIKKIEQDISELMLGSLEEESRIVGNVNGS